MYQPESLRTDEYLPWSRGRGNDVWSMFRAAADGDLATIQALVEREPQLIDCEFQYYRPFHFAVQENRLEVVRYLLGKGADPMCGGLGFQPAYLKANPNNLPWPLSVAGQRGHQQVLELLERTLDERFHIRPEGETLGALIRARDFEQTMRTLDAQPELLHVADSFGNQPLHWAVMTRNLALIDALLARGADLEAARPDGCKPIDLTNGDYWYRGWRDVPAEALRKHEVLIGYLLARGAYYDICTAAQLGDLARVRALLDERPERVNALPGSADYYNGSPLRNAAEGGHLAVVQLLLDRGAKPNLPEPVAPWGAALYNAIAGKYWKIVKLLLEHGADATAMVESSGGCYWRAKRDGAPAEILQLLAAHGGCLNEELACYDGDVEALATMLQANPQLSVQEHLPVDNEAIVQLVQRHQPDVLKKVAFSGANTIERARWLLEQGVDCKSANWLGITPLHRMAIDGKLELAALCVEFGADLNAVDDFHASTPLGWAARGGRQEIVEWLINQGADPQTPTDQPWAWPIEWARRQGHDAIVALLDRR